MQSCRRRKKVHEVILLHQASLNLTLYTHAAGLFSLGQMIRHIQHWAYFIPCFILLSNKCTSHTIAFISVHGELRLTNETDYFLLLLHSGLVICKASVFIQTEFCQCLDCVVHCDGYYRQFLSLKILYNVNEMFEQIK